MTREGRRNSFSNKEIKAFQRKHFSKKIEKKFLSNKKDQNHIPIVLVSDRKMALTLDKNFKTDLENFPRFTVEIEMRPEELNYK